MNTSRPNDYTGKAKAGVVYTGVPQHELRPRREREGECAEGTCARERERERGGAREREGEEERKPHI